MIEEIETRLDALRDEKARAEIKVKREKISNLTKDIVTKEAKAYEQIERIKNKIELVQFGNHEVVDRYGKLRAYFNEKREMVNNNKTSSKEIKRETDELLKEINVQKILSYPIEKREINPDLLSKEKILRTRLFDFESIMLKTIKDLSDLKLS